MDDAGSESTQVSNVTTDGTVTGVFAPTLLAPELVTPSRDEQDVGDPVDFAWRSVANATGYTIQVARESEFVSPVSDTSVTGDTALGLGGLAPGTLHYWRVRAVAGAEPGPWSSMGVFETATPTSVASATRLAGADDAPKRAPGLLAAAPNPADRGGGKVFFSYTTRSALTARLRIYDVTGNVVHAVDYKLRPDSKGAALFGPWDLNGRAGKRVGAGTYLAVLQGVGPRGNVELARVKIGVSGD